MSSCMLLIQLSPHSHHFLSFSVHSLENTRTLHTLSVYNEPCHSASVCSAFLTILFLLRGFRRKIFDKKLKSLSKKSLFRWKWVLLLLLNWSQAYQERGLFVPVQVQGMLQNGKKLLFLQHWIKMLWFYFSSRNVKSWI